MYRACDGSDGWEEWKVGLTAEVETGGCSAAAERPAALRGVLVALALAILACHGLG